MSIRPSVLCYELGDDDLQFEQLGPPTAPNNPPDPEPSSITAQPSQQITPKQKEPTAQLLPAHESPQAQATASKLGVSNSAIRGYQALGYSIHMGTGYEDEANMLNWDGDSASQGQKKEPEPELAHWPTNYAVNELASKPAQIPSPPRITINKATDKPKLDDPKTTEAPRLQPPNVLPELKQQTQPPTEHIAFEKKKKPHGKEPFVISFSVNEALKITFLLSEGSSIEKTISSPYLQYLQQYFPTNFNKLLPTHNPVCLQGSARAVSYVTVYFNFLVQCHPQLLLKFLREETYTEAPTGANTFEWIKGQLVGAVKQGYELVSNQIKKRMKQQQTTQAARIQRLQRILTLQLTMTSQMQELRKSMAKEGVDIVPSAYEQGDPSKKYETLSTLDWLMGFQQTIDVADGQIAQHDKLGEKVVGDRLRRMLHQFRQAHSQRIDLKNLNQCLRDLYV